MARLSAEKRNELEAFWRAHIQGWSDSTLNQREYCEAHGLPLKRFGNWRAKLRGEVPPKAGKLLYRHGGGLSHMLKHMRNGPETPTFPRDDLAMPAGGATSGHRTRGGLLKRRVDRGQPFRALPGSMESAVGFCSRGKMIMRLIHIRNLFSPR